MPYKHNEKRRHKIQKSPYQVTKSGRDTMTPYGTGAISRSGSARCVAGLCSAF